MGEKRYWKKFEIDKIINLPITRTLYGCETWFFTSGKGHRLRISEHMVLQKIIGLKGGKVTTR